MQDIALKSLHAIEVRLGNIRCTFQTKMLSKIKVVQYVSNTEKWMCVRGGISQSQSHTKAHRYALHACYSNNIDAKIQLRS